MPLARAARPWNKQNMAQAAHAISVPSLLWRSPLRHLPSFPPRVLTPSFPPGGKIGTSVDVTVSGVDLDGATEKFVSRNRASLPSPRMNPTAPPIANSRSPFRPKLPPETTKPASSDDMESPTRAHFAVGDLKELDAPAKDPSTTPQPLAVDSVASGKCPANLANQYSLELKQGARVLIECAARKSTRNCSRRWCCHVGRWPRTRAQPPW